jgi:hypothetical protein
VPEHVYREHAFDVIVQDEDAFQSKIHNLPNQILKFHLKHIV